MVEDVEPPTPLDAIPFQSKTQPEVGAAEKCRLSRYVEARTKHK